MSLPSHGAAAAAAATAAGTAASASEAVTFPVHYRDALTKFDQSKKRQADFKELMHAGWKEMERAYEGAKSYISYVKEDKSNTEAADAQRVVQDFEKIVRSVWTTMAERKPKTLTEPAEELFREQEQAFSQYLEGIIESVSNAEIYKDKTGFNMRWDAFENFVNHS